MQQSAKAPVHLWIIGIVSLIWNAIGVFDYLATKLRLDFYMSQFTPEQLDYFYSFPAWAVGGWALGVWGALIGSLGLLLRKSWAVSMFAISVIGLVITSLYNFVLTDGADVMGEGGAWFSAVIWIIGILLFFYARAMAKRGVLN